jgi:hypothetical protein
MRIGAARTIAAEWVVRHAQGDAAFRGAFFSGSTISLPPETELPPSIFASSSTVLSACLPPIASGLRRFLGGCI